jgi:hypothetical protein
VSVHGRGRHGDDEAISDPETVDAVGKATEGLEELAEAEVKHQAPATR